MNDYNKIINAEIKVLASNKYKNKDLILNILFKKEDKILWMKQWFKK